MVIAFSAGGTLGHIMPALSFIEKLKSIDLNIKIIFFMLITPFVCNFLLLHYIDKSKGEKVLSFQKNFYFLSFLF